MDKKEYDRPEPEQEKENRAWGILLLAAAVVLLLVGYSLGWIDLG